MALKDIFKKRVESQPEKKEQPAEKEVEREVKQEESSPVEPTTTTKKVKKKVYSEAYRILVGPHVTEKATDLSSHDQYVFRVFPRANKIQIKKAVENVYGVDVINVNVINIPKKKKRWGRTEGFKKGYKKAIVKIKQGQKIDVLPG